LLSQGKVDEALAVYKRCVQRCDRKLATGSFNMQAHDERRDALDQIVQSSFAYTLIGEYGKALTATEYLLSAVPNLPIANVKRAHALMLSEKQDEARVIYLQHREQKITRELTGAKVVLQDFKKMREVGRLDLLMDEIETLFSTSEPGQQGRTLSR
jgi:tetratricopeptide (TPR) repeat protein